MKSRRCAADGCNKYPAFNVPGENTARYCGDHRQQGMIDVHNKRCNFEGCIKRPTFNYPGATPPFRPLCLLTPSECLPALLSGLKPSAEVQSVRVCSLSGVLGT